MVRQYSTNGVRCMIVKPISVETEPRYSTVPGSSVENRSSAVEYQDHSVEYCGREEPGEGR